MDSSSDDTAPKRHSRHGSSGRAPIIRRSTRGPLDINETPIGIPSPLNPSSSMAASQLLSPTSGNPSLSLRSPALRSPQMRSPRMQSPTGRGSPGPSRFPRSPSGLSSGAATERDFTGLLRPEIYHPLPHLDIPTPFRSSSQQPSPSTPLSTLLASGHFRPAAIAAASQLTSANPPISPSDHATIFSLLYIRLSCLCLCGNTTLAAQEVLALEDLNSAYYRDDATGMHLVPWELRVLAVRLQGMGFNDARRGVMGYYDLGREARAIVARRKMKAKAESTSPEDKEKFSVEIKLWETRLADLGIRVAGALIEMEDLEGAAHFLSTLKPSPNESGEADLSIRKALLWLCLGDVGAARGCVKGLNSGNGEKIVEALALMADGEYEDAVTVWKDLVESGEGKASEKAMWASNLAVALLYCGRLEEAKPLLESQVDAGHAFHALTFNLSTVYELCTERSRAMKMGLAEKVASAEKVEGGGSIIGWEKVNTDFKL